MYDLWFALRRIRRRPLHSAIVALTLGLGIGAALAVFGIIDAVLLRPLPYRDADRLVRVMRKIPVPGLPEITFSDVGFRRLVADNHTLAAAAAITTRDANLIGRGAPRRITTARVSASLFDVLQVRPRLGRAFSAEEDVPNARRVIVLSDALWRSAFNASPAVIGTAIDIDGEPFAVIGVLPPDVTYPNRDIAGWEPVAMDPAAVTPYNAQYNVVARLRPRVSFSQAADDITRSVRDVGREFPGPHAGSNLDLSGFQARVHPLADAIVGDTRPIVGLLLAGVAMLLALTCTNVASLQLASALARREELAVRAALGATRTRLARGALLEGALLAACGTIVGLGIAAIGARLLGSLLPPTIARPEFVTARSIVAMVALVTLVAAVVGALPIVGARWWGSLAALRDRTGGSGSAVTMRVRRALAAAQVALAVALLHGAGLLMASAQEVRDLTLGFRPDSTMSLRFNLRAETLRNRTAREGLLRRLVAEAAAIPGVSAVGLANALPLTPGRQDIAMALEGRPFKADGTDPLADYRVVSGGYFEAMGIRLLRGRTFTDDDANATYTPLVISEGLAREIWGDDTDPVGHRLRFGPNAPWMPIVGVVAAAHNRSLTESPRPELYAPALGTYANLALASEITLIVRSPMSRVSLARALQAVVARVDPDLPVYEVASMRDVVSDSRARIATATRLMSGYAVAALLLAAAGTYAVLSFLVAQRRRELAVRMALGASPRNVVALVARESVVLVAGGIVAGLLLASGSTRLLAGLLYGVGAMDVRVVSAVAVLAGAAGVVAALAPARRATRVDPCVVLRDSG